MLRWRKVATVIRREYLSRVKTKAFWLTTLALPVVLFAFTFLPNLLIEKTGGVYTVAAVTGDDELAKALEQRLARPSAGSDEANLKITLRREAPTADATAQRTALKQAILDKRLTAVVIFPAEGAASEKAELLATNTLALRLIAVVERAVNGAVTDARLAHAGIPADRVALLTRPLDIQMVKLGRGGSENAEAGGQGFLLAYSFMMILWISTMIYGFSVMRAVVEEKSSRVVEVIVANLSPFELMAGKILGVGAVGLTQYAIWVLLAMNLSFPGVLALFGQSAPLVSPTLLAFFVVFFVLGYLLFSTFYAAVGAAFSSEEEAHQVQSLAGWVMFLPIMLMFAVMSNPDSVPSVILSLIPFFSPGLFFVRMTIQFPPVWQILLCFALLIAAIVVVARFAAAIYRVGILMYGKRPTVREVMRWARAT